MTTEKKICPKCIGVGHIEIEPHNLGWLRKPDYEKEVGLDKLHRAYERPDGVMDIMTYPFKMRVYCPVCHPRRKQKKPFGLLGGK